MISAKALNGSRAEPDEIPEKLRAVLRMFRAKSAGQTLRVPLNGKDRERKMFAGFDDVFVEASGRDQPLAEARDALMMSAVD